MPQQRAGRQSRPSENHRPEHAAWAGTLLPADDPWWDTHFTPNGWGCKCRIRQVSRAEAGRLGGPKAPPPEDLVEWTNPRTGRRLRIDRGLDPAWSGNPGRDRERVLAEALGESIERLREVSPAAAAEAARQIAESPLEGWEGLPEPVR